MAVQELIVHACAQTTVSRPYLHTLTTLPTEMRIIAGSAKGRRLKAPDSKGTRPATDRVREAVFSMIGGKIEDARVLDLYAGTGSFGLEALSRGAAMATFVENERSALVALKHNIETCGLGGRVVATSVEGYLIRDPETFDLVFLDPPWDLTQTRMEQQMADLGPLLAASATVIISRRHSDPTPRTPETWQVATDRRYGDTRIVWYEKVSEDS